MKLTGSELIILSIAFFATGSLGVAMNITQGYLLLGAASLFLFIFLSRKLGLKHTVTLYYQIPEDYNPMKTSKDSLNIGTVGMAALADEQYSKNICNAPCNNAESRDFEPWVPYCFYDYCDTSLIRAGNFIYLSKGFRDAAISRFAYEKMLISGDFPKNLQQSAKEGNLTLDYHKLLGISNLNQLSNSRYQKIHLVLFCGSDYLRMKSSMLTYSKKWAMLFFMLECKRLIIYDISV